MQSSYGRNLSHFSAVCSLFGLSTGLSDAVWFQLNFSTVFGERGNVSLLSHCEKVMASVILQRIRQRTEEILSEAQGGFRPGRSTIDQLDYQLDFSASDRNEY